MTASTPAPENKTFLPADYLDEVVPEPRDTPSAWIVALPGDAYALAPFDEGDEPTRILKSGDLVSFCWHQVFGSLQVTIRSDESFTSVPEPHPIANGFWERGDTDSFAPSLTEFAKGWLQNGGEPEIVEVDHYFWSDGEPYRFEVGADGPRFVLVEAGR